MKYLKLFEGFNNRNTQEVEELLDYLFVEIFDKWKIKEIPDDIEDGPFFANLDTEEPYYKIRIINFVKQDKITLTIAQNIFDPHSIEIFKEMVRDCQPVLNRFKSFGFDFRWDSSFIQNPYNFGRMAYFKVSVEINK